METIILILRNLFEEEIKAKDADILKILEILQTPKLLPSHLVQLNQCIKSYQSDNDDENLTEVFEMLQEEVLVSIDIKDFAKSIDDILARTFTEQVKKSIKKRQHLLDVKKFLEDESDAVYNVPDLMQNLIVLLDKIHDENDNEMIHLIILKISTILETDEDVDV